MNPKDYEEAEKELIGVHLMNREEFNEIVSLRRKEYLNQIFDEKIDKPGGFYEKLKNEYVKITRKEKFIKFPE